MFPKLLRLDGELLPPLILFDIEGTASIPDSLGSFYISSEARDVAVQFIQQYITMYDSDCRKALIDAYHESAMFVLASHKPSTGTNLFDYIRTSRNLLRVPDTERRLRYLYRGKHEIVACLQRLPSTQHDPVNLVVDVCVAMPSIMTITLSGIFKELTSKNVADVRAFSRTWILVPNGSGFNIINETYLVTNATSEQVRKAFKTSTASASISPIPPASVPTSSAFQTSNADAQQTLKQEMLASFCQQSGMNTDWALKCLEDNKWDYEKAASMFREMNDKGSIPAQAFVH